MKTHVIERLATDLCFLLLLLFAAAVFAISTLRCLGACCFFLTSSAVSSLKASVSQASCESFQSWLFAFILTGCSDCSSSKVPGPAGSPAVTANFSVCGPSLFIYSAGCIVQSQRTVLFDMQCVAVHGDISQSQRTAAVEKFKSGEVPLLIATDVAARGLDIPDVEAVINYSFPLTTEDYVHRIGRTGRAGKTGNIVFRICTRGFHHREIHLVNRLVTQHDRDKLLMVFSQRCEICMQLGRLLSVG